MNRTVEASPTPLPSPLFWLEKGYPSTLILDPYAAANAGDPDADKTQKREAVRADGTQELQALDIVEEIIADAKASKAAEPRRAKADGTQEIQAGDILEEASAEIEVELAPPPPPPPPPPPAEPLVVLAPLTPPQAFVAAPRAPMPTPLPAPLPPPRTPTPPRAMTPMPMPAMQMPMQMQALAPQPLPTPGVPDPRLYSPVESTGPSRRITALATAEWERRRRFGQWAVGGALLVASALVLAASAVHAFAADSSTAADSTVFTQRSGRVEDTIRNGKEQSQTNVHQPGMPQASMPALPAAQGVVPTVSIDSLPVARRGRR